MNASITNPVYSARLVKDNGTTYKLKDVTTSLIVAHPKDELAEKVSINLANIKVDSSKLIDLIDVKDNLYVNANTGSGEKEVFRGFVWSRAVTEDSDENEIEITAYDRLIYLQKSKDNFFIKAGKKTNAVISSIASRWGFKVSYKYSNITHAKLTYHDESIADIIIDILNKVKKQTGVNYIIHMDGDTIVIEPVGSNKTVYKISQKENAVSTYHKKTMEGMVTKVLIVKAETTKNDNGENETGNYLTVASVSKNTDKYGTLQDIITISKDEKLSEAKEEANQTIKDHSNPKIEEEVKAVDIPWVKKGHQIYISSGKFNGYYIIKGIEHDAADGIMYLEVEAYE